LNLEELVLPLNVADKAFKVGVAGAIAGVTALVGAMGLAIKTTFEWAGELDAIGDVMDVTNEQAAAFAFIARKSGVATETFTKSVVIMSKGLVKADGSLDTVGKGLQAWGVNVKDVNGNLKSQTDLVDDISKKYNTFATQQEKVNFLTEVFGRSGAELVDFFDVMAAEGGMDAVTEKVKAFGLAIDPARYENFTRSLEEIKLIGTGLAVGLTEQLMPALEGVLGWVGDFAAADPAGKWSMFSNVVRDGLAGLFNLTDAFKQGMDGIDWAGLSTKLAEGIQNIDWAVVGLYVREGAKNIFSGIGIAISEINWQALADSLGSSFAELIAGLYGYPDWEALSVDFMEGLNVAFEEAKIFVHEAMLGLGSIIFDAIVSATAPIGQAWDNLIGGLKQKWQDLINFITGISLNISPAGLNYSIPGGGVNASAGSGTRRASGGAVSAGQRYQVAEFNRPEMFTPSVNGRIDPLQPQEASMGSDVFIQRFADVIARSLRSELQKSGRK